MELSLAYRQRSQVVQGTFGLAIALSPNLRRDRVSYGGVLKAPLRFREAMCALHDVVVSDLRYKPRDKTAYEEYKAQEAKREAAIRSAAYKRTSDKLKADAAPMPAGLEADYQQQRKLYWRARQQYSNYLLKHDWELWRHLMPCDPVITVADDSLFFECFSADESSYGCLTVDRDAFQKEENVALGTTNVDYSWDLYEHFQRLRSYRETRFDVDPTGFDVQTTDIAGHREEKIDLPNGWLRGFMQLQSAMSLPLKRVTLNREAVYNLIAFLKRNKAQRSPRAIRFELTPGKPVQLILEPWERTIETHSSPHMGDREETIRIWGRDRLKVLARVLPLLEQADVYLLGTGLPSFWVIRMGEMRMILGLSGWTTNDWTAASALQQIVPPVELNESKLETIAGAFTSNPSRSLDQVQSITGMPKPEVAAGLNRLALLGQVIHDLPGEIYRWRQVMPLPLTSDQVGSDNIETVEGDRLTRKAKLKTTRDETTSSGLRIVIGTLREGTFHSSKQIEIMLDGDGRIVRGKCGCSHCFKNGLRKGPCRYLQAMRNKLLVNTKADSLDSWFRMFGGK